MCKQNNCAHQHVKDIQYFTLGWTGFAHDGMTVLNVPKLDRRLIAFCPNISALNTVARMR